MRHMSKQKFES